MSTVSEPSATLGRQRVRLFASGSLKVVLLLAPGILLVTLLGWGLIDLILKSLHSYDSYLNRQGAFSLDQYRQVFSGDTAYFYRGVFIRTIWISAVVTIASVAGAIPIAYFITRTNSKPLRLLALMLALVPFLVGEVVRAFGWLLLLGRGGVLGWASSKLGGHPATLIGTVFGVWLGAVQTMLPIAVFILLPSLRRVAPDLERAAATLGARPGLVWTKVVLPLIRPGMVAAAVVVFALSMTEYAIPDILGGGVLPFAGNAIQAAFFNQGNIALGSALAVVLLVVVLVIVTAILAIGGRRLRRRPAVFLSPKSEEREAVT